MLDQMPACFLKASAWQLDATRLGQLRPDVPDRALRLVERTAQITLLVMFPALLHLIGHVVGRRG